MSQKISAMPSVLSGALLDDDFMPVDAGGITSRAQIAELRRKYGTNAPVLAVGNGTADDRTAFATAEGAGAQCRALPANPTYKIGSSITLSKAWAFDKGAVIKPAAGVTVTIAGNFRAGAYQVFDLSLGGSVAFAASARVEGMRPEWWGAVGDGVADDTPSIAAALAQAKNTGTQVICDAEQPLSRVYGITSTVLIDGLGIEMVGNGSGAFFDGVIMRWIGTTSDANIMVKVTNTSHGSGIRGFTLDANLKAGICLQVADDGVGGNTATFDPVVNNITFMGYRTRGLVMGKDTDPAAPVQCTMQMGNVFSPNLRFLGGVDGAIGLLVNAQNLEKMVLVAPYFDPPTTQHLNHIYSYRGSVSALGMITTRASDYAVVAGEAVSIVDWNAEERYIFKSLSADPGGPSQILNLRQRVGAGNVNTDLALDINTSVHPFVVTGTVQQSIRISGVSPMVGDMRVHFALAGAGYVFPGFPQNQRGSYVDMDAGSVIHRGTAPRLQLLDNAGNTVFDTDNGVDTKVPKDINATGGYRQTHDGWMRSAIAANLVGSQLVRWTHASPGPTPNGFIAPRAGSITQFGAKISAAPTAGTITVKVTVNGVVVGPAVVFNVGDPLFKTDIRVKDAIAFAAGDRIDVFVDSAATLAPTTISTQAWVEVET